MTAKSRYDYLSKYRSTFLDTAVQCSQLTLPTLIQQDDDVGRSTNLRLITP